MRMTKWRIQAWWIILKYRITGAALPCWQRDKPIHNWFELTYAQYLTIPRSVLQSMPVNWQRVFVKCLEEMDEAIDWLPKQGRYWVRLKDADGRFIEDPLMDYDRGRRMILITRRKKR